MQRLDEIRIDGYNRYKLYDRVRRLTDAGLISPERGRNNELLLDDYTVQLLEMLASLEAQGKSPATAVLILKNAHLERRIADLEEQIRQREREIARLQGKLQLYRGSGWFRRFLAKLGNLLKSRMRG